MGELRFPPETRGRNDRISPFTRFDIAYLAGKLVVPPRVSLPRAKPACFEIRFAFCCVSRVGMAEITLATLGPWKGECVRY